MCLYLCASVNMMLELDFDMYGDGADATDGQLICFIDIYKGLNGVSLK